MCIIHTWRLVVVKVALLAAAATYAAAFVNEQEAATVESSATIDIEINKAFCGHGGTGTDFPMSIPEHHMPWVFEAVYDPILNHVEVTVLPDSSCAFNRTRWHEVIPFLPKHARKELADGLEANILVNADIDVWNSGGGHAKKWQTFQKKSLLCLFYNGDVKVGRSESNKLDPVSFEGLTTLQAFCPVPAGLVKMEEQHGRIAAQNASKADKSAWNRVALQRSDREALIKRGDLSQRAQLTTESFPVCSMPTYNPDSNKKQYNISVCTATLTFESAAIVEWIEFHKLQGVDHFYIYCTNTDLQKYERYRLILADYIAARMVTFISFPYKNCVNGMASGRSVHFRPTGETQNWIFRPPKAIAQTGALASCYSRFKQTTKYMTHIDLDEFIMVSNNQYGDVNENHKKPLLYLANKIFNKYPEAPSFSIKPVFMQSKVCKGAKFETEEYKRRISPTCTAFPRLGQMNLGRKGTPYETKPFMRTDAVDMHYIHYITALKKGWQKQKQFTPHLKRVALFHYKPEESRDNYTIWGKVFPFDWEVNDMSVCRFSAIVDVFAPTNSNSHSDRSSRSSNSNSNATTAASDRQGVVVGRLDANTFTHYRISPKRQTQLLSAYSASLQAIQKRLSDAATSASTGAATGTIISSSYSTSTPPPDKNTIKERHLAMSEEDRAKLLVALPLQPANIDTLPLLGM